MRRFAAVLVLVSFAAFAQTNPQKPAQPKQPKPQVVDFEKGTDITGEPEFPIGVIYERQRTGPFKSMIKIRENFNDKLYASVNEM